MNWFPLTTHSHFSLQAAISKPEQIAARVKECGYAGAGLTDIGSISGVPAFIKSIQDICAGCGKIGKNQCRCGDGNYKKAGLKPIAGCEFHLSKLPAEQKTPENATTAKVSVLAKGLQGWRNLIKASSASYRPEHNFKRPRLDLEKLAAFSAGEFLVLSGHLGTEVANSCFESPRLAYTAKDYEEARTFVRSDWETSVLKEVGRYKDAFGDSFYLSIQLNDQKNLPSALVVARIMRWAGKKLGVRCVATADTRYSRNEDAGDHRVVLCSALETTMKDVSRKLDTAEEMGLGAFFRSSRYHIPTIEEMVELHNGNPEELENSLAVAEQCGTYEVGGKPMIPQFDCPRGLTPDEYMKELCEKGWKEKIVGKIPAAEHAEYEERLWKIEFPVLAGAGLSSYFLIVADYIDYAVKTLKTKVGLGRGSAAGCIVSYLMGITRIDPIRFKLLFARFYNAGRNSPGRIALPDIDTDFTLKSREKVIQYCRDKYGPSQVAQMSTFSRMQGRGALKDVLRTHDRCSFEEMNLITEHIPDESEIIDQLQLMMEETGEASIIRYALENNAKELEQWAYLTPEGEVDGPLGLDFAQAIRLEGTKRSMGKHASGLVICSEDLSDVCPMVTDKSTGELMVGVDMRDAEAMGLVKFDVLGLRTLDCICDAEAIIRTGKPTM